MNKFMLKFVTWGVNFCLHFIVNYVNWYLISKVRGNKFVNVTINIFSKIRVKDVIIHIFLSNLDKVSWMVPSKQIIFFKVKDKIFKKLGKNL